MGSPVVFLDRDGVINKDLGYVHQIKDFVFVDGIINTLQELSRLNFEFIIVTNQSGIGRGYYTEQDFQTLTKWMIEELEKHKIKIKAVYHCPHTSDQNCQCRKPLPGMLLDAITTYTIDTTTSWMIGDSERDIIAAHKANVLKTIRLSTKKEHTSAAYQVDSASNIATIIRNNT